MFKLLNEIKEYDKNKVGSKAFNCSQLLSLPLHCKDGFVIINSLTHNDIKLINKNISIGKLYAVRSSMIDEDLIISSNAGKYKSIIAVEYNNLPIAIEDVLQSSKANTNKAVLIQELVMSEAAGVLFTKHPIFNTSKMLINACLGAGENVVSSLTDADYYEIDENIINKKIAEKKVVFSYGFDSFPGEHIVMNGIEVRTVISNEYKSIHSVFFENINAPALNDNQIYELYKTASYLRNYFGCELDIEFSIAKNTLYILQVRPITILNQLNSSEIPELEKNREKITGQIASGGIFKGKALVITNEKEIDIKEINKSAKDKVLVMFELLPEIMHCIDYAGAIITAKSGILSHGAIVAREKGIPCITGLGEQIFKITSGMELEINANIGVVSIE